jgi:hypothetical protein
LNISQVARRLELLDLPEGLLEHLGEHLLGGPPRNPYLGGFNALLIQQLARALRFS